MEYKKFWTAFDNYLTNFDRSDPKIALKITHTFAVVDCMDYLTAALELPADERELARIIALLHDIGRFAQLARFDSFSDRNIDHAALGVSELEREPQFQKLLYREKLNAQIIKEAILNHNRYQIDPTIKGPALLYARLIRDADKLDNLRNKQTEKPEVLLDAPAEAIRACRISPAIARCFLEGRLIPRDLRETLLDRWASYIAFIFDLNFQASFQWITEKQAVPRLFARFRPADTQTFCTWQKMEAFAESYLTGQLKK
ncbi:HD domain-containing protein [Enterococcus hirae]|nr:HD domain-containing protein [Enterococcus hirae]